MSIICTLKKKKKFQKKTKTQRNDVQKAVAEFTNEHKMFNAGKCADETNFKKKDNVLETLNLNNKCTATKVGFTNGMIFFFLI